MNTKTRLLTGALALALFASACVADDSSSPGTTQNPGTTDLSSENVILTAAPLQTVNTCSALLDRLIAEGVDQVGPYGFGGGRYSIFAGGAEVDLMEDQAMAESTEATFAASDDSGASLSQSDADGSARSSGEFSGTNTQEVDVDEADMVKTDGKRLLVLNGNTLRVVDVSGPKPRLERTIKLEQDTWAGEMFLVGDRALLLSQGWTARPLTRVGGDIAYPDGSPTSKIIEVNVETGEIGQTIEFEGSYLSAREVDGSIRVVLTAGMGRFPFLFPSSPDAEDSATEANRRLIEESTIEQWLPTFRITEGGNTITDGPAVDCSRVYLPKDFSGFGSLNVLTINLDDGMELLDSIAVVTEGQTVYASTERLTVATAKWPEWNPETGEPEEDQNYTTSLHSFDITDLSRTEYVGSGEVKGHLLSQYSLSEYNGYLRVATTQGDPWWGAQNESESFVTVFEENDGELRQVGQVGGLGKGERIFSVRFMADIAYVVTFRQVDPLYTVDLSEPSNPTVLGELKIPGFSTYLHPVGDGLLLGIGQDATDEGQTTGAQMSLFDVSDLSNPQRIDTLGLGENSYSSVDWDPKAFLFWADESLASVPVSWWGWDEASGTENSGNAAVLVNIGDRTLSEIGRIGHPATRECENYFEGEPVLDDVVDSEDAEAGLISPSRTPTGGEQYCWSYQAEVRRTVVIGDTIFTVSDGGVQANELDGLREIAWLPFS